MQITIPGAVYELAVGKDGPENLRSLLEAGEKRNKGRGYRVFIKADQAQIDELVTWAGVFVEELGITSNEKLALKTFSQALWATKLSQSPAKVVQRPKKATPKPSPPKPEKVIDEREEAIREKRLQALAKAREIAQQKRELDRQQADAAELSKSRKNLDRLQDTLPGLKHAYHKAFTTANSVNSTLAWDRADRAMNSLLTTTERIHVLEEVLVVI